MYTDKEQKHLNRIMEGSPVQFSFPAIINNAKLSGEYVMSLDTVHMFGSLGTVELTTEQEGYLPADDTIDRALSGDFMPLFTVDAKELRKVLRSFKYTHQSRCFIGNVVNFHNDQIISVPNVILSSNRRELDLEFVKEQWMRILNLMSGEIEVGVHLGKNTMWYFIQQDRQRFGVSMLMDHDLKQLAEYSLTIFADQAKQEFSKQHSDWPARQSISWDEAKLVAKNTDWTPYFNAGYTPYSAACDRWQQYRQIPKTFKADKIIMAFRQGKPNYFIRKNGVVRRYVTNYKKNRKIAYLLDFWGYKETRRWNRRVYTAPQED